MSNELIVPAMSRALRRRILDELGGVGFDEAASPDLVTILPPDRARENRTGGQVNIFLYQTTINASWRNQDIPGRTKSGEPYSPPLPLDLHYLLTFYGNEAGGGDEDVEAQRMLALAGLGLHERPSFTSDEMRAALEEVDPTAATNFDGRQEPVRLSPTNLNVDELSRLWAAFQVKYRLSTAFVASVVLIEARTKRPAAAPVISRGSGDRGFPAEAGLTFPQLDEIRPPETAFGRPRHRLPGVRPGDLVTVTGRSLAKLTGNLAIALASDATDIRTLTPESRNDTSFTFRIPDDAAALLNWPAGLYALAAEVAADPVATPTPGSLPPRTNRIGFPLLPSIQPIDADGLPVGADNVLTIVVSPPVQEKQEVALVVGSSLVAPNAPIVGTTDTLSFALDPAIWTGPKREKIRTLPVRVRVDGVDSLLIDPASAKPEYDSRLRLKPPGA